MERIKADDVVKRALARQRLRSAPARARQLRLQAGLSLREVAQALGCSPSAVCRWEGGTRLPRGARALEYLELLRKATGQQ